MHKEIIIPIYDALVYIGVGSIPYQLRTLKKKYDITETANHEYLGFCNHQYSHTLKRNVFYIVIANKFKDKKSYWNTVAHELFHLTQEILEQRGIYFVKSAHNEPYTYTNGYLTGEAFEFFEKAFNKYKE